MFYKNICLTIMLLCTCYGLVQATLLTDASKSIDRDRELHLRLTTSTPGTANSQPLTQLMSAHSAQTAITRDHLEMPVNEHSVAQQEQYDTDCLPLCFLLTGECAEATVGYPNLGTFVGIVGGLIYEALQCMSE